MFFRKKSEDKIIAADVAAAKIGESVEKNIGVYTMPKRFLGKKPDADQAKTTGLLILISGFIILLAGAGFCYWFYFLRTPTAETNVNNNTTINPTANPVNPEQPAKSEEENNNNLVATSSLSNETSNVASSTGEESASTTEQPPEGNNLVSTTTIKEAAILALDTDGDGLLDPEEAIFSTDPAKRDTDGDGYEDLAEVKNGYNPAGQGKILVNPNFEIYSNPTYGYSLYYPKSWSVNNSAGDNSIVFAIDGQQFVQVIVQDNSKKQAIEDWYKEEMKVNYIAPTQFIYKKNWTGIKSEDGLIVYLLNPLGDKIFTLVYNLGENNTIKYKNIFDLLVDSLK